MYVILSNMRVADGTCVSSYGAWRDTLPIRLLLIILYPVQQEPKQICKNEIQFYNNERSFFYKRFFSTLNPSQLFFLDVETNYIFLFYFFAFFRTTI